MSRLFFSVVSILLMLGAPVAVQSENTNIIQPDSLAKKTGDATYEIGNVILNTDSNEITLPGRINMDHGPVEYLAVATGGKTYESVLVMDIQPLHLQVALLLCGLDYGQNLAFQGDTTMPEGDSVEMMVQWISSGGDTVIYPASKLVYDFQNKAPMTDNWWVFTGSFIYDKQIAADMEGSLIATYSDPVAILNTPSSGRIDDTVYGVNEEIVPAAGTPIKLIIKTGDKRIQRGDLK